MADDIDELLDQVEESLSNDSLASKDSSSSIKSASPNRRGVKNSKSESVKTDDLRDLLDDLEDPPLPPARTPFSGGSSALEGGVRCNSPYLAGTSVPSGMATAATLRACDSLRCLDCDLAVVVVEGFCWDNSTDYLFLRNNYPNLDRLRAHLEPQRSDRAYACQCQHRSLTDPTTVAEDGGLKWVCCGHVLPEDE